MKALATILSFIITSFLYSQSENLVDYRIDAKTVVTEITVIAMESREAGNSALGRVGIIQGSTINLELNPHRNYTVIINGESFVEIKERDIAEFQAREINGVNIAGTTNESIDGE